MCSSIPFQFDACEPTLIYTKLEQICLLEHIQLQFGALLVKDDKIEYKTRFCIPHELEGEIKYCITRAFKK